MNDIRELIAFITARLDEDEEAMRRIGGSRWYACDDGHVEELIEQWSDGSDRLPNHHNSWALVLDPARVLREVEAKRALLEQFRLRGNSVRATVQPVTGGVWDDLLLLLALPYSDHPDYRQKWTP